MYAVGVIVAIDMALLTELARIRGGSCHANPLFPLPDQESLDLNPD